MNALVEKAEEKFGQLSSEQSYGLIIPCPLGGKYTQDNFMKVTLAEVIRLSGHIALQIQDLPDGAQIELKVTD